MNVLPIELLIIAYVAGLWLFMRRRGYQNPTRKFIILFLGVLFFEMISEPMWLNSGFSSWAYVYRDITWVLTLAWVGIFMTSIVAVDYYFRRLSETKRFFLYLLVAEAFTIPFETFLIQSGFRGYAPVLLDLLTGLKIPFTTVPVEAVYAIPLFTALIFSFYKYVNKLFEVK